MTLLYIRICHFLALLYLIACVFRYLNSLFICLVNQIRHLGRTKESCGKTYADQSRHYRGGDDYRYDQLLLALLFFFLRKFFLLFPDLALFTGLFSLFHRSSHYSGNQLYVIQIVYELFR